MVPFDFVMIHWIRWIQRKSFRENSNVTLSDGKLGYAAIIIVVLASVIIVGAGAAAVLYYIYRTNTKRVGDTPAPAYQNMAYESAETKTIPSDVVQIVKEGLNEKQWKEAIAYI